ncbi:MAG: energy transducer TonB [Gemmatimonadales bacterium]
MLEVLIASRPQRQAAPAAYAGAFLFHAVMLSLGIVTTGVTVHAVSRQVDDTTLIFLPRLDPVRSSQVSRPGVPGGGGPGSGGSGIVMAVDPPALGFQVIDVVSAVPTGLPSLNEGGTRFDPRDYTGRGVEGGAGWGVVGGTGSADQDRPPEGNTGLVYSMSLVDERFVPAEMLVQPKLVYPAALQAAGIPGRAELQFVIDTTGLIEAPSVTVLTATHEAFANAARESIAEVRFAPARYGGRAVRQLSRLPIKFVLHAGTG